MKPALTAEEWARLKPEVTNHSNWLEWSLMWDEKEGDAHAFAAMYLHGQPFGFHRGDVRLARENGLHSLADRIASLLPPEEE